MKACRFLTTPQWWGHVQITGMPVVRSKARSWLTIVAPSAKACARSMRSNWVAVVRGQLARRSVWASVSGSWVKSSAAISDVERLVQDADRPSAALIRYFPP